MAEQVIAEYKLDVNQAVKGLDKLQAETKQLDKDLDKTGKDGTKALDSVGKEANTLSSSLKKLGGVIAAAFAVDRLISFGKEAVNVAAKAEGVERAFKRIGSADLLKDLRAATRGTVSDLLLMQRAVQASNFKIPLDQLAGLLKFAQARARETGESVDYLVDSIVLGIGRKSPLILDNLGISAVELRERLKGVGVEATSVGDIAKIVGDIASEELAKMGEQADTTADKLAQLATIWQNFTVTVGEALINLGTGFAFLAGQIDGIDVSMTANEKAAKNLAKAFADDVAGAVDMMVKKNQELLDSQLKIAELEETRGYQNSREAINNINKAIEAEIERQEFLREYIKQLKAIYDASKQVDEVQKEEIRNVFFLQNAIKALKDERANEGTTRERILAINKELIPLEEELAILLGKQSKAAKDAYAAMELRRVSMSETVPIAISLLETLDGLNDELARQNSILNSSPEFSKQYNDAKKAIQELKQEIKTFNDDYIDPSEGFIGVSTADFINTEDEQSTIDDSLARWSQYANEVGNLFSALSQIQQNLNQEELDRLQTQLDEGIISQEEYDVKRREILTQQAEDQKAFAVFDAAINGALAIVNAFAEGGPVLAALVGAAVAAEIAAIASAPVPQFKDGGLVKEHGMLRGKSHAQGGIHVEAEGNEYFMPTKPTMKNYGLLEAMRKGIEEQYIMKHYVPRMIDESLYKGMNDIGKSAELNGLTANLKDHNIIAGLDRLRQSQTHGFKFLAKELKTNNRRRGGYA